VLASEPVRKGKRRYGRSQADCLISEEEFAAVEESMRRGG
jgi:hypothetical protein